MKTWPSLPALPQPSHVMTSEFDSVGLFLLFKWEWQSPPPHGVVVKIRWVNIGNTARIHIMYNNWSIFIFIHLFIYFWLRWVFVAARGLSLVRRAGGYSSLRCAGFSLWWLLLLRSTGLVALPHVGSSRPRVRTRVSCIGRRILNHCTTREVLDRYFC